MTAAGSDGQQPSAGTWADVERRMDEGLRAWMEHLGYEDGMCDESDYADGARDLVRRVREVQERKAPHGWIWAFCDVVGNLDNHRWVYSWDGETHRTRQGAIKAGLTGQGSDDFLVAQLDHGKVVWVGWQDEEHSDAEDRDALAAGLGLTS